MKIQDKLKIFAEIQILAEDEPQSLHEVINAFIFGIQESNRKANEKIVLQDKALLFLSNKKLQKGEIFKNNAQDIADVLTHSTFNGIKKIYTVEDVINIIK